jgi:type IX secretion system substrate protein/beta-propeller repeat-containing protein
MDFPVSGGAWQSVSGGALDAFIAKFDSTGNNIWSTYIGGSNSEDAHAVKFDPAGNIITGGDTYSSNFPVSTGAFQNFIMGGGDAYLAKFNGAGNYLWSTYLGGVGNEDIEALACDAQSNIYLTGYTASPDLPYSPAAFQTTMNGVRDAMIGSFNGAGNLRWLTYCGGTAWDSGRGIIVNMNKKITVCGETNSTDFPIAGNKYDTVHSGVSDIFYITVDTAGTIELSNLYGGANADYPHDICEVIPNKIIISGSTYSTDFPVTAGVFQTTQNGDVDAFVWQTDTVFIYTEITDPAIQTTAFLYPNPANEKVIITGELQGDYDLMLTDIAGKELMHQNGICNSNIQINNLQELPAGMYYILLTTNHKRQIFKLVIP